MRRLTSLILAACLSACANQPQAEPEQDAWPLVEAARSLVDAHGDIVWTDLSRAPFGVLLVTSDAELLLCHGHAVDGFSKYESIEELDCDSQSRAASFSPSLLATFPAIEGVPTIVVGTPEATGLTQDDWVLTLVHEHFHQMQYASPGYYSATSALDLHDGDETGMWMLNYAFPYENPATHAAFQDMGSALKAAMEARGSPTFYSAAAQYVAARRVAKSTMSARDWSYYELQAWQEGVARWTEIVIGAQEETYRAASARKEAAVLTALDNIDLKDVGRLAFYPLGAGEAALLDASDFDWKTAYWTDRFQLGASLETAFREDGPSK